MKNQKPENFPQLRDVRSLFLIPLFLYATVSAQTLGGSSTFNFLRLSNTPQLTALGGIHVSSSSNDVGMAFNNPSLLNHKMHTQLNAVFNDHFEGIKSYHLSFGFHTKWNINMAGGLNYIDLGTLTQTDASGNIIGSFRPVDYVMQLSVSKQYLQKWNYGMTLKYINSNYGAYRSNGIGFDAGVLYTDSASLISASLVVNNLGTQLKTYAGTKEELPFDLQLGVTKRLKDAPLSFSITLHHLHHFNISYNDTLYNNDNGFSNDGSSTFDKMFRHVIFAAQAYPIPQVELSLGYNHLRRKELSVPGTSNALTGFSMGVGAIFRKLQVRYARSYFQSSSANNQLGLNLTLNEHFGLGRFGERIGW